MGTARLRASRRWRWSACARWRTATWSPRPG